MINATISADIIKSTSLNKEAMVSLYEYLKRFVDLVEQDFKGAWGRIVRGDCVECVLPNSGDSMRVAVMLKCFVKAFDHTLYDSRSVQVPHKNFRRYGVRIAIGIGSLRTNDGARDIIDGKAIYRSGRALDGMSARMRSNLVIDGCPRSNARLIQALLNLTDELLSHATARQCHVIYMRLRGMAEKEIAARLNVSQPAVNAHLRKAGWYAVENAVHAFEEVFK